MTCVNRSAQLRSTPKPSRLPVRVENLVRYGLDGFEKIGDPGHVDITFNAAAFVDALEDVRAPPCVQLCNESEDPSEWVNGIAPDNWWKFLVRK